MYRQMGYEDIIIWANNKIKEKSFEIPSPFSVGVSVGVSAEDAVRELVLENCTDIGSITPNEILEKQQYLDEIEKLKTKINTLENNKEKAFEYLKEIYNYVYSYVYFIQNFVKELRRGSKSISDLENESMWQFPPQNYGFDECAECLGKSWKAFMKGGIKNDET